MKLNRKFALQSGIIWFALGAIFIFIDKPTFIDKFLICAGASLIMLHNITTD
jgi:hypothetical protein